MRGENRLELPVVDLRVDLLFDEKSKVATDLFKFVTELLALTAWLKIGSTDQQ